MRITSLLAAIGLSTLASCDTAPSSGPDASAPPDASPAPADARPSPMDAAGRDAGALDGGPPPEGLVGIGDFEYAGAFRIAGGTHGASSTDFAIGTLGYCPDHGPNGSFYLAGFRPDAMVAEFALPPSLGTGTELSELPVVDRALQGFQPILDAGGNPERLDMITGMLWVDGDLVVNANVWYDAGGEVADTTLIVRGGVLDGTIDGYFRLEGAALAAGFMAPLPPEWHGPLGGPALVGWASNYSIISRYSVGPSLYTFDPSALVAAAPAARDVPTRRHQVYPHSGGRFLDPRAVESQCEALDDEGTTVCEPGARASALWNWLATAMYGFVVPGTRTYALFGSLGGSETGIGYKIRQDDGNLCGGFCARGARDHSNYYWFFDLNEILAAEEPWAPRPYAYGPWSVPFDGDGQHHISGGAYAPDRGLLYLTLYGAGQVGMFDVPPVVVAYRVPSATP
ncbi:MAG: hypothetical protein KF729_12990 [Sandaracinaceae bacterium]|nr:hypothetical protein [Sandaracinaceae bacterium]